eukprot:6481936-Amphidinium_carterae.1
MSFELERAREDRDRAAAQQAAHLLHQMAVGLEQRRRAEEAEASHRLQQVTANLQELESRLQQKDADLDRKREASIRYMISAERRISQESESARWFEYKYNSLCDRLKDFKKVVEAMPADKVGIGEDPLHNAANGLLDHAQWLEDESDSEDDSEDEEVCKVPPHHSCQ